MQTRRIFISRALALAGAFTVSSLAMTGCSFSVAGMLNTILSALQSILKVAAPNAPWLASLQAAIGALQNAETQWQSGGAVAIVEDALNTVEAVLAVIPLTAAFSPLIDVIVAAIEAVINYFAPAPSAVAKVLKDPHRGRAVLNHPHVLQTYQGAFKDQFNKVAADIAMPQCQI